MKKNMRTPTDSDMNNAEKWLVEAMYNLKHKEYFATKKFCKQVIRALRR